jgi:tryptophan synthase beta chain
MRKRAKTDPAFKAELDDLLKHYVGRPSRSISPSADEQLGGAKIYFKREELNHTGAHKINNVLGQICSRGAWARSASSPRPAPASTASPPPPSARFGLECVVYMGAVDVERQKPERLPHEAARRRGRAGQSGAAR